jgi:hypothetical protein
LKRALTIILFAPRIGNLRPLPLVVPSRPLLLVDG